MKATTARRLWLGRRAKASGSSPLSKARKNQEAPGAAAGGFSLVPAGPPTTETLTELQPAQTPAAFGRLRCTLLDPQPVELAKGAGQAATSAGWLDSAWR